MNTTKAIRYAVLRYSILRRHCRKWKVEYVEGVGFNDSAALSNLYRKICQISDFVEIKIDNTVCVCDAEAMYFDDEVEPIIMRPLLVRLGKNVKEYAHYKTDEVIKQKLNMPMGQYFFEVK